jgi:hypothetical protein
MYVYIHLYICLYICIYIYIHIYIYAAEDESTVTSTELILLKRCNLIQHAVKPIHNLNYDRKMLLLLAIRRVIKV